jgi:TonB family protein
MKTLWWSFTFCLLGFGVALAIGANVAPPCKSTGPLLRDAEGKAIWLNSTQILKQASYCEAPRLPKLPMMARIQGTVVLSILVNDKGEISCTQTVSGHPLLLKTSTDALKKWKFKPISQAGKRVGFYGTLEFHFWIEDGPNSCLDGH